MTFTFVCQSCDDTFELEHAQLAEETRGLKCPNCGRRLPAAVLDELVSSVDELLGVVASLRKRFAVSFEVDADDLPSEFEDARRSRRGRDEDDEDEEEDEDDDDVLLGDDEDDVDEEDSY